MSDELWDKLRSRQERIETALRAALHTVTVGAPGPVVAAMTYALLTPGKRLRPLLTMLACEAARGLPDDSLPAACAVEMIHTYSLVHDDLPAMDDDDLRRGQPACHRKFGEALAILAGDALLTASFEVLTSGYPARTAAVGCLELARGAGVVGMVGGQTLDLVEEGRIEGDSKQGPALDRLEELHTRKTGALFRTAMRLGIHAAQVGRPDPSSPEMLAAADRYAAAFGLAFQITDDLLDVESTADKAGKRVRKDADRGKLTYPGVLGVEESRRKATRLGEEAAAAAEELGSQLLADVARSVVRRDR